MDDLRLRALDDQRMSYALGNMPETLAREFRACSQQPPDQWCTHVVAELAGELSGEDVSVPDPPTWQALATLARRYIVFHPKHLGPTGRWCQPDGTRGYFELLAKHLASTGTRATV